MQLCTDYPDDVVAVVTCDEVVVEAWPASLSSAVRDHSHVNVPNAMIHATLNPTTRSGV